MKSNSYPDHYPDGCPPNGEESPKGKFFRMIPRSSHPERKDFLSVYEKQNGLPFDNAFSCEERSISIFADVKDCINFLKNHPRAHQKYLASLKLSDNTGVLKKQPEKGNNSHHNWWIPIEIDPIDFVFKLKFISSEFCNLQPLI